MQNEKERTCQEASHNENVNMKYINNECPLLGYDFTNEENRNELYECSKKIIKFLVENNRSYSESRKIMEYVKLGLKTLKFKDNF